MMIYKQKLGNTELASFPALFVSQRLLFLSTVCTSPVCCSRQVCPWAFLQNNEDIFFPSWICNFARCKAVASSYLFIKDFLTFTLLTFTVVNWTKLKNLEKIPAFA